MTIEPFPHSGALSIASVHPCKHSSVMKKVLERMDGNVRELQRRERSVAAGKAGGQASSSAAAGGGSKWLGLGGKKKDKEPAEGAKGAGADEDDEGLRVEQYLLVFLKFISTISAFLYPLAPASLVGVGRPAGADEGCTQPRQSKSIRRPAS